MKILVTGTLTLFLAAQQRLPSTLQISQRSEEHTSELQSPCNIVCRLLLDKKNVTTGESCSRAPTTPRSAPAGSSELAKSLIASFFHSLPESMKPFQMAR